ncbi:MAG TPA: hypothetical protein PK119_00760 [Candidatus Paceibacterota bacterium]|nr:hypothetical protein [Candidatus Paceibacterota bacterium]
MPIEFESMPPQKKEKEKEAKEMEQNPTKNLPELTTEAPPPPPPSPENGDKWKTYEEILNLIYGQDYRLYKDDKNKIIIQILGSTMHDEHWVINKEEFDDKNKFEQWLKERMEKTISSNERTNEELKRFLEEYF